MSAEPSDTAQAVIGASSDGCRARPATGLCPGL